MNFRLGGAMTAVTGLLVRASNQVIVLLVTLIAAHFLTPAIFGVFAIASAMNTLVRTLMYTGPFEYFLKAAPSEEAPSECLAANVILSAVLTTLLCLTAPFSGRLFGAPAIGSLLLYMAPSNLISAFTAWQESQLLRTKRVRLYYGLTALSECVAAACAVGLLLAHFGLGALVAQIYGRCICLLICYGIVQKLSWSRQFDFEALKRITSWSASRYGGTLISFVSTYSADFFLGAFLSPAASGLYRASSRIVTAAADMIAHPTQILSATTFSKYASNGEAPDLLWPRFFAATSFLGWSALAGLAAVSDQVVPVLLGPKWVGAGPVISILCLARAISLTDSVTTPLLVAFNQGKRIFQVQFGTAIASAALLILVARFGVMAAALSSIAVATLGTLAYLWPSLKLFPNSKSQLWNMLPVAALPAIATFTGAEICRHLVLDQRQATIMGIGGGIAAWLFVALLLKHKTMNAIHAFNE